jgi:hypothetical protein
MRTIAVALTISMTACSFPLVSGPPAHHRELPTFDCTESRLGPGLDTVWTVLQSANLLLATTKTDQQWNDLYNGNPPISRSSAIPLYAVFAALGAAGMYYGFTRTAECREAKFELRARAQQPMPGAMPGTWPPPPPPGAPLPPPPPPAAPLADPPPAPPQ